MRKTFEVAVAAVALLVAVGWPTLVLADHAEYDRSEPAAGATVAQAPTVVRVWFTNGVRSDPGSFLHVENDAGQRVDNNDSRVDLSDPDRKLMTVTLRANLPPGTYKVEWQTISADEGEREEGEFSFLVGAAAPAPAQPAASPAAKPHAEHEATAPAAAAAPPRPAAQPAPAQAPRALPRTGSAWPGAWLIGLGGILVLAGALARRRLGPP